MSYPDDESLPIRPVPTVDLDPEFDPTEFYNAFRETFLSRAHDAKSQNTLREFGHLLNSLALEVYGYQWYRPVDRTAFDLRSALFDLRHLQYFFAHWGEWEPDSQGNEYEQKQHHELLQLSRRTAQGLEKLGDDLEKVVGDWKFVRRRS